MEFVAAPKLAILDRAQPGVNIDRRLTYKAAIALWTLAVAPITLVPVAAAQPTENVETIIQRSVEANAADWKAAPDFDCMETDRDKNGSTRTYEDLMLMGSPYQRLVAIDGKPLSKEQQAEQQQRLDNEIAKRKTQSPQQRTQRIAKYDKERERNNRMLQQLTRAFDFSLTGEAKVDGYDCYVLKATPKVGYHPPNNDAEVLTGMEGTLWIAKQNFQWVKVEAEVVHPVSIEGFVAKVEPGTRFELEKMPVGNDLWLPKHYEMTAKAKVLFFFSHNSQENQTYYGYRPVAPQQK